MTTMTQPRGTRIIGLIAAIWYAFGLFQCLSAWQAMGAAAPLWVWIAFALASTLGLIGAGMFAAGQRAAAALFGLSLISALVYFGWLFTRGTPAPEDAPIAAMVLLITAGMLWLSKRRFG